MENASAWEICERKLSLNTANQLESLVSSLTNIVTKCIEFPHESKYFSLNTTTVSFQKKIAKAEGGCEYLQAAGFAYIVKNGEKWLCLPPSDARHLDRAITWITDKSSVILALNPDCSSEIPCAECILQIRFPNGSTATGGFMKTNTIQDVLSFAKCYVQADRVVSLQYGHSKLSLTDSSLVDINLEELGLYPRAVLIASISSDAENEAVITQKKENAIKDLNNAKIITEKKIKSERLNPAITREEEKKKILAAFKDDHSK